MFFLERFIWNLSVICLSFFFNLYFLFSCKIGQSNCQKSTKKMNNKLKKWQFWKKNILNFEKWFPFYQLENKKYDFFGRKPNWSLSQSGGIGGIWAQSGGNWQSSPKIVMYGRRTFSATHFSRARFSNNGRVSVKYLHWRWCRFYRLFKMCPINVQ